MSYLATNAKIVRICIIVTSACIAVNTVVWLAWG